MSMIYSCYLTLIHPQETVTRYVFSYNSQSFSVDRECPDALVRFVCEREMSLSQWILGSISDNL